MAFTRILSVTAVSILAAALAACTDPRSTVVPTDMSTWDKELAPIVQKLSDEDKQLLVAYVARMKLAEVFSKEGGIPFGTTVGDAIDQQRKWKVEFDKAEAEAKVEREKKAAEEQALKARLAAERASALKQINEAVTVTLLSKRERYRDMNAYRFTDTQEIVVGVENRSDKEVIGVSGAIEFIDVFDKAVGSVGFSISHRIKPGGTYKWNGARDYNKYLDEHRAIWNLEDDKYSTRFIPESVVFADRTKLLIAE